VDRQWTAALRGEPYDIEHRIVVGNAVKWVRERAEMEFDADGQLLGGFGITQDISDRKQSEKALRESEARFRLLADTAAQLLATDNPHAHVRDLAGRVMAHLDCHCFFNFLVVNEEPGRLRLNAWAGIPEEEARRIEWLDFGVAVCGCVAREGRPIVAEHIPATPDVRTELVKSYGIKAYACHPLTGVDGRMLGTLSFGTRSRETFSPDDLALMRAVTDQVAVAMVRMQNEQALRNSEEALRKANEELEKTVRKRTRALEDTVAALKNEVVVRKNTQTQLRQLSRVFMDAADPIIIEDLSGKIVELNREAEVVYGWSREELIGTPIDTLFLPEREPLAARLRERCCSGEEIRNWEGLRKARSGRIIPNLLTAFPLLDESGQVAFVATISKDISARKEMEERLNEAQRHLQALSRKSLEALEADRRSVARELHDSIGGSLAAIKFGLEEVAGQAVRDPVGGSRLLGTLISHLADTIKETKRISANLRPLSIDDLGLLATIDWYTRQFSQRYEDIRLVRQIDVQEHEIPEDYKIVLYRVMQEALTNAARHSKADTINIRLKKEAGCLELEVEDNGCGFNPRKASETGDGLSGYGLRSMQERAEICGGSITVQSRPGAGTHIRAALPVTKILAER
jgi:PAS domain S-box-containing protein